jgi:hypothetical protein
MKGIGREEEGERRREERKRKKKARLSLAKPKRQANCGVRDVAGVKGGLEPVLDATKTGTPVEPRRHDV